MIKGTKYQRDFHFHHIEFVNMAVHGDFSYIIMEWSVTRGGETETAKVEKFCENILEETGF